MNGIVATIRRRARMAKRVAAVGIAWIVLCSSAVAHPGHGRGGGDFGVQHYLSEPVHLFFAVPVVLLLALCLAYVTGIMRPRARRRS
jgi:hydrogenase/urease accessory protein HupE